MRQVSRLSSRCWLAVCTAALLALNGCGSSRDASSMGARPHIKIGQPYQVLGHWYHPQNVSQYEAIGVASWYGRKFHGRLTANGELYDMNAYTAAHPTLPLPSLVEVTNLENGRRMVVRVNDRGPFVKNREIDLSRAAARALGFERQGLARVHVRLLGPARLEEAIVALNRTPRRWERPPLVVAGACPPTAAC